MFWPAFGLEEDLSTDIFRAGSLVFAVGSIYDVVQLVWPSFVDPNLHPTTNPQTVRRWIVLEVLRT